MHKYIDSIIIVQLFLSISHYLMSFLRVFFLEFYAIHFRNLYAVNHAFASIDHGSNGNSWNWELSYMAQMFSLNFSLQ